MYNQTWVGVQHDDSVVVQVKACSNAHILLSEVFGETANIYEIALGVEDNKVSEIRQTVGGLGYTVAWTSDILSCDEFRTFWFMWVDGIGLDVGRGSTVGSERFMRFVDLKGKDINAVSFSTGSGSTGQFRISNVGGE